MTNSSDNQTNSLVSSDVIAQAKKDQLLSTVVGFLGIITTCGIGTLIVVKKSLRFKYPFFNLVAFGDFCNAFAYAVSGVIRFFQISTGEYFIYSPRSSCLSYVFFPFYLVGNQLPAVATFIMAVERVFALFCPIWFTNNWTPMTIGILWKSSLAMVIGSTILGYVAAYISSLEVLVSAQCNTPTVTGNNYALYNYGMTVLFHSIAFLISLVCLGTLTMKLKNIETIGGKKHMKRQRSLILGVATISFVSFLLIVLPNVDYLGRVVTGNFKGAPLPTAILDIVKISFCLNSALSIFFYPVINGDFREALFGIVRYVRKRRNIVTTGIFYNPSTSQRLATKNRNQLCGFLQTKCICRIMCVRVYQ